MVQPTPPGLCDAIFRSAPLVRDDEPVLIGLPDTVWYPADGFCALPDDRLAFLLFPVDHPEFFDAVVVDENDNVSEIQVKQLDAASNWVWGAFKMPGRVLHELRALWRARDGRDEYIGTLVTPGWRGDRRQGRHGLCRCRHVQRLPRSHQPAQPRRGRVDSGRPGRPERKRP